MSKTPRTSKKSASTVSKSKKPKKAVKKPLKSLWNIDDKLLDTNEGFVYLIENLLTGKKYVGRKYFHSRTTLKPLKGKKRRRKRVAESNWRTYTGSCKELNDDIQLLGVVNFSFKVLHVCRTRAETNYAEVKEQFLRDVLHSRKSDGDFEYYNSNILARYYRSAE